ncbi:hypothetical protein AJ80_09419 [Polytolypa hystricis UAMH7299]|uniref:Rhodopsin domain-containing protein n=1 Tax=Polytolypa hystricis (strain UAMH7299) TaxID=1447883 RepID=A0A2B7WR26_POLH7|nr:hypothetical protein AJ80_09419 [Polytolypa hystricis UAMH7299]
MAENGDLSVEPGLNPPPGITSNFENPERSLNQWNIVTQALCISLTTVFFALRMYTRKCIHGNFNREDWTCALAWLLGIGYSCTAIMMGEYGGGIHQWDVPRSKVIPFNKTVYGTMVLYGPTAFLTKVSILLILTRVFTPYNKMVIFIYTFFGLLLAYYIPAIIIKIRICSPISHFWLGDLSDGTCLNEGAIIIADAIISVISDLIILVLPLFLTQSLQMPVKKRVRIICILGAGGLACASSIVRLVLIIQTVGNKDQTFSFVRVNVWGNAEVSIGIVCACLPALAAFINRISQGLAADKTSGSRDYEMGGGMSHSMDPTNGITHNGETGSDRDILITHPQGFLKIETAVRAGKRGDRRNPRRDRTSFNGCGIMKTVDVSHTVSEYR